MWGGYIDVAWRLSSANKEKNSSNRNNTLQVAYNQHGVLCKKFLIRINGIAEALYRGCPQVLNLLPVPGADKNPYAPGAAARLPRIIRKNHEATTPK